MASQQDSATRTEQPASRFVAYMMLMLSFLVGAVSLLVWMAFLFHGSLNVVNLGLGETARLGLNAFLCLAFFIQHSTMIRRPFRQWLARIVRVEYHGTLYAIASGVFLLVLIVFWQKSAHTLVTAQGIIRLLMRAVFFLSVFGFCWGTRALGAFDAFGTGPILKYVRSTPSSAPMPFTVRGPYRWVRHPLYFFCLLLIWSCPDLSVDRLLYNVLWTVWIVVGTVLEERDLVTNFGDAYRDYQKGVPMLIPRSIRPAQ